MGLLEEWGVEKIPTSKKEMSWEEIVDKNIDDQIKIFNGDELKSSKKDKNGNYPLRPSWYKENKGYIVISITNFPLLPSGEGIPCSSKQNYGEFLQKFKQTWKTDPNIKSLMDQVKVKYDDRLKTLRKNSK